jgi:hypothetical protein
MVYFYRFDSLFTLKRCYYKKIQSTQGVTTNINEKQERLYIYIYIYGRNIHIICMGLDAFFSFISISISFMKLRL